MAVRKVEIRVSVDDLDATKRLDALAAKLDKLSKGTFTIRVRLDDGGTAAKLDKMAAKLDKMSSKVVTPRINDKGILKTEAEIDKLNAKLDKLGHKRVTTTVHVRTTGGGSARGRLEKDIADAGGAGGGGASGGLLSALAGANNSTMGALIAALVGYGFATGPALIPFGLGGLVGGGGTLLAGRLGATGISKLQADRQALAQARAAIQGSTAPGTASASQMLALHQAQQQLATARTSAQRTAARAALARAQASIAGSTAPGKATPSQLLALHQAQAQLGRDQSKYGGFVPFGHAANNLGNSLLGTFLGALTGKSPGFSAGPHGQPGGSFLQGLVPIFAQISGFLKSIGPDLGNLFRASLPSLAAFIKIFEQFAKAVLPAMTQSLNTLNTSGALPVLVQGFKLLSEGIAGFITNLGPGMKDAAIIFKGSMMVVKGVLQLIGVAASDFAIVIVKAAEGVRTFARNVPHWVDVARHDTAKIFDEWRHGWASIWDQIWNNTVGRAQRGAHDIETEFNTWRHNTASIFDGLRHDIATEWDNIWNNTKMAVLRGIGDVVTFFKGMPSKILAALKTLGGSLMSLGETALNDFLAGLKSVGGSVLGWIKSFFGGIPSAVMKMLHMSPPHPGSAFFDLGANFMHHMEAGIKSRVGNVVGSIKGVSGHVGGSVNSWIIAALHASGKPMSWLPALQRLVSLESGGNPRAVDPISVLGQHAEGLWQMLPSTFFGYGGRGSLFNPVIEGIAALRYISSRYGSPFNIPGLFSGGYRGYAAGGIITEPILGMGLRSGMTYGFGERGIHERVTPLGAGGSAGGNIYITVAGDTDPDGAALRIVQKIRKYKQHRGNAVLGIA